MIKEFEQITLGISELIDEWEPRLLNFSEDLISTGKNTQHRTIKQILGHLIDSASNNTHRIVHFQYQESPMSFPNYATNGNNDRWIGIQNYQGEDWITMINLWKYSNRHIIHVISNVDPSKLENQWFYSPEKLITLKEGIVGYLDHLKLHLNEIAELAAGR